MTAIYQLHVDCLKAAGDTSAAMAAVDDWLLAEPESVDAHRSRLDLLTMDR
jgi:hypothetical protein